MKKIVFCLIVGLFYTYSLYAQSNEGVKDKELTIVYIAHPASVDLDLNTLVSKLDEKYRHGVQYKNDVIFYMSNGTKPLIVRANAETKDEEEFNSLTDELFKKTSHEVEPNWDVNRLIDIVNDNDFIDNDGKLRYSNVTFDFYITKTFLTLNYHESLIAKLYFALDINKIKQENPSLFFSVYCSSAASELTIDDNQPFGLKNFDNINEDVKIFLY